VIPSVMVFLSLTLPYPMIRWANIILGIIFTGVILLTFRYARRKIRRHFFIKEIFKEIGRSIRERDQKKYASQSRSIAS